LQQEHLRLQQEHGALEARAEESQHHIGRLESQLLSQTLLYDDCNAQLNNLRKTTKQVEKALVALTAAAGATDAATATSVATAARNEEVARRELLSLQSINANIHATLIEENETLKRTVGECKAKEERVAAACTQWERKCHVAEGSEEEMKRKYAVFHEYFQQVKRVWYCPSRRNTFVCCGTSHCPSRRHFRYPLQCRSGVVGSCVCGWT